MKNGKFALVLLLLFTSNIAFGKIVQILHTNDIHSRMMFNLEDTNRGGYATLKTMVDKYTHLADGQGIPTVLLDGGDYLEGSLLYIFRISNIF